MKKAKILVVDDDGLLLKASQRLLESAGYETLTAQDGPAALELTRSQHPDLVLLDVNMPGMDGFEICRRIKAEAEMAGTFVLLLSGMRTDSDSQSDGLEGGADGYLVRPVPNRELLARVQAMLRLRAAEQAMRESEERFATIFHSNPAAIALTRVSDSRLVDVSEAWLEMTGYTRPEVLGHTTIEFNLWAEPAQRERMIEMLHRQGRARDEVKINCKSGEVVELLMSAEFIELAGERYLLTMAQDITEQKQAEEDLRRLNAELEQRVEERTQELRAAQEHLIHQEKMAILGQLAGGVGHELRNPLGVISNAAYYLQLILPEAGEKVKRYLGIIASETRTAEKIIADLLDFSRTITAEKELLDVTALVRQALDRFPAPSAVSIHRRLARDLPPTFADPRQVEQVLGNLLVNAYQAMPEGGKLTLSASQRGDMLAIAVKDTGAGINPEDMQKLFEPLFTTKLKGIGLGLAVSRRLLDANGGWIKVKSEPGKGSTFTVFLPVRP